MAIWSCITRALIEAFHTPDTKSRQKSSHFFWDRLEELMLCLNHMMQPHLSVPLTTAATWPLYFRCIIWTKRVWCINNGHIKKKPRPLLTRTNHEVIIQCSTVLNVTKINVEIKLNMRFTAASTHNSLPFFIQRRTSWCWTHKLTPSWLQQTGVSTLGSADLMGDGAAVYKRSQKRAIRTARPQTPSVFPWLLRPSLSPGK